MKYIDSKKKPIFFKFIRGIIRIFYRKRTFINCELLPDTSSLIIGNHCKINSPLTCELFFPTKKYIWCIGQMMKVKEVPTYTQVDFWQDKPKIIKWFYNILSYLIAPIAAYIFNRADTIAVYKDTRMIQTYKESLEKLNEGANIIIFPECHQEYNHIINEFQDKFIDTARFYYKKTGKCLAFVPMYNAVTLKKVVFGKPIEFNPHNNIEDERQRICDYLKDEITRLAEELPRHKVVPYSNIKKKKYIYNKK